MSERMKKGKFENTLSPSRQEAPKAREVIDQLSERLGFIETEELSRLRSELIAAMTHDSVEEVRDLVGRYLLLGEQLVSEYQDDDFARAQIGRSIRMALIRRDAGRVDDYLADLEEALEHANSLNYDDIVASLEEAITLTEGEDKAGGE
jgi:hypothetical protein